jgi:hypothetical protein
MPGKSILTVLAATALATSLTLAAPAGRWIHVHVETIGEAAESVRVNLPLDVVGKILPAVQADRFDRGRVRLDSKDLEGVDVRAIWEALSTARDGEFVTVEGTGENVRVSKSGPYMNIRIRDDSGGRPEQVDVQVPLAVVNALFSGSPDELDVLAAIQALDAHGPVELVRVDDGESRVRIWVDERAESR